MHDGAGKSTAGPALLRGALGVTDLVNADVIAQGLSAFEPEGVALTAGKVMLTRLRELAARRATFAFETTLAGRSYARWLAELKESGYKFRLIFLWLPTVELAVQRVADRVKRGGHGVPEGTIRRRHDAGLRNFFERYQPLADSWRFYDASSAPPARLVAAGSSTSVTSCLEPEVWNDLIVRYEAPHNG